MVSLTEGGQEPLASDIDQGRELVAVDAPPGPELAAAVLAALDGGPAVAPLPQGLPPAERAHLLAALRPARVLTPAPAARAGGSPVPAGTRHVPEPAPREGNRLEHGPAPRERSRAVPTDVAVVVATSGSTGAPKGVELTASALLASARAAVRRLGLTPADRWLACLPLSTVGGVGVLVRSRVLGTDPVVLARFDVAAVDRAAGETTCVALVPTMLVRLLDAGVDLSRFRRVLLGGASATPALLRRAAAAGAHVTTTYGMTETCGGCVYDGVPLDGVRVAVRPDGRITVTGPVLARAYREGGRSRRLDDPFTTGDLGRLGADGRLHVLGRADDVIVTGGRNVVAGRVAALLAEHPAVADAAVVGRPDPEWGERLVAVVVPTDPAAPPDLPALRDFVATRAPRHEAPRELVLADRLPLLPSGKVDRLALREGRGFGRP